MHAHDHHGTQTNLPLAVAGNGFLALVEASVWAFTGSVLVGFAALHDACDCATSFASCMAHRYEHRWPRLPHISACIMLLLIIGSCLVAIVQAFRHIVVPEEVNLSYVWLLGVLGLVVNGLLALRLEKGHTFLEHVTSTHFYEDAVAALLLIVEWVLARWIAPERLDPVLALIGAGGILILAFRRGVSKLFFQEEFRMSTASLPAHSESMSLSDQIRQLENAIDALNNKRVARGVLSPDDQQLFEQCLREHAALRRKIGD